MALDHHGNRDANNGAFLKTLSPAVMVEQLWRSDQPGQEVVHRINNNAIFKGSRDVFALGMNPETAVYLGPWLNNHYQSKEGYVLIRVMPGGERYEVWVLQGEQLQVKQRFGPYVSK